MKKENISVILVKNPSASTGRFFDFSFPTPPSKIFYRSGFTMRENKGKITIEIDISNWELAGDLDKARSDGYNNASNRYRELLQDAIDVLMKKKIAIYEDDKEKWND